MTFAQFYTRTCCSNKLHTCPPSLYQVAVCRRLGLHWFAYWNGKVFACYLLMPMLMLIYSKSQWISVTGKCKSVNVQFLWNTKECIIKYCFSSIIILYQLFFFNYLQTPIWFCYQWNVPAHLETVRTEKWMLSLVKRYGGLRVQEKNDS